MITSYQESIFLNLIKKEIFYILLIAKNCGDNGGRRSEKRLRFIAIPFATALSLWWPKKRLTAATPRFSCESQKTCVHRNRFLHCSNEI